MNNKLEGDDLLTCVEPVISYYSTSSNLGVTAIYSKKDIKPYNLKYNSLFTEFSPKNNFSVCNTIMIPFITNESGIYNDNNNYYSCNVSQNTSNLKDKDNSKNSIKIDNTRIKTISSKGENKENEDSVKDDANMENLEKNPFFLGKNLSLNYVIDKKKEDKLNFKHSQEEINEDENENDSNNYNKCKFIGDFINRTACKSVNINDLSVKSIYLKDEKKNKSQLMTKKNKKAKIKDLFLNKKIKIKLDKSKDKDKDNTNKKVYKNKSFFLGEQSKSLIEETKNYNNQKLEKILIEVNQNNHSGGNKRKSYYYSNKIVNTNNNENYFKAALKKNNVDKIVEDKKKENDKDKEQNGKTERKKIKKQDSKTPLKNNNNNTTSKFLKIKIQKENNRVIIKHQSHSKQGINILKEHIKIKEPDKKDESPHDHSVNLGKEKSKKEKNKKLRKRKSDNKDNKDSDTEEKKMTKTPNRRASGFSFKKKNKRKNTEKQDNNSDQKTLKTNKTKKDKEKDNISRSNFSLKDSNNTNIKAKIKMNNSLSKKDLVLLQNIYDNKDNVEKLTKLIRRKRSISVNLDKSILVEVAKAMKGNEHDNKSKDNTHSKTNTNTNLNIISISNMGKGKKLNKKNFDFEKALKKNSKKMQFNLFSKDKFTNSEIINSDYLKYTLNCMELIIDIDMEKQTRLKNKINFNFPKPKKKNSIKKRIALFDLDETLVHCTGDIKVKKEKYQHAIEIKLPGKQAVQVGINLRPLWKQTLKLIKKYYHIVIYTASHQAYADSVLDFMDPKKKYFKYRLYRNNCSLIDVEGAKFYVKDLDILNEYYDLKDIVIIDNSVLSFAFHLHNGIPIVPYYDEDKDGSLYVVGLYLNHIFPENDLREANKTQINLDSFLEEAKKQKEEEEEENVIDEEPDDEEEEKSLNNSNKNGKEKQEGKEKEGQNDDNKKVSDKKVCLNAKRWTCFDFPTDNQRRENHDSTQKKLISRSKLLNMYYEVNDESTKSKKDQTSDGNLEDKKSVETLNGENNKENGKNKGNVFIMNSGNGEIDCKSDPGYPLIDQNNNYNSDNDSVSDDNIPVLKRGFTIIEEPNNKIKNNIITGKLNYIRSNFYNNFKI